jgi:inorganic pyrophosphatase
MPDSYVVIVEIPGGSRNKYEYDHESGAIFLDRRLFTATRYPTDYGFFPETLAEDGDPLDALVLVSDPTFPGCHIRVRPIGVFWMEDEKGPDAKVLTVPVSDPVSGRMTSLEDLELEQRNEIEHFFMIYKDLEPGERPRRGPVDDRGRTPACPAVGHPRLAASKGEPAGLERGAGGCLQAGFSGTSFVVALARNKQPSNSRSPPGGAALRSGSNSTRRPRSSASSGRRNRTPFGPGAV